MTILWHKPYLVKVTTIWGRGVKFTQNFDHVVYGWPHRQRCFPPYDWKVKIRWLVCCWTSHAHCYMNFEFEPLNIIPCFFRVLTKNWKFCSLIQTKTFLKAFGFGWIIMPKSYNFLKTASYLFVIWCWKLF